MGIDISRLGKNAQAQIMAKMAVQEVRKRSKYGNRKVVRDGIKFDSEREAARFGELKVLRAMGRRRGQHDFIHRARRAIRYSHDVSLSRRITGRVHRGAVRRRVI